jgi:hypothetical protein
VGRGAEKGGYTDDAGEQGVEGIRTAQKQPRGDGSEQCR